MLTRTALKQMYFRYETLTKIKGEPDLETLMVLRRQIYANAAAVPNVHHGKLGFLGLVMSREEYARHTNIPFERPGPVQKVLSLDVEDTQYNELQQRERQYQREQAYEYMTECKQLETTILDQICEAIDEVYILAHMDPMTGLVTCTIPDLIHYLFDTYGYISPVELEMKRSEVTQFHFTAETPMDVIFYKINSFARLSEQAKVEITEREKIGMAKLLIGRCGAYQHDLIDWGHKPEIEHTWNNFMIFFRNARMELRMSTWPIL